jgi:hypothetical protein
MTVIPFTARVTLTEIRVPQPGDAAPSSVEEGQRNISTSGKLDWLDAVMADHSLGASAKVAAFCIMQHLNRESGTAFVSDKTITDKTGIGNRWVRESRNELRASGWITWKRTKTASVYSTLTGPMAGIEEQQRELKQQREERRMQKRQERQRTTEQDDRHPSAEHDRQPSAELVRHPSADIPLSVNPLDNPLKGSIYTGSTAIEIISAFETFWQQYPLRVGKLKAEKIYNDIVKSKRASAEELLAGAGRYAAEQAGQPPKWIKHPSTWLNGHHWRDEPQAPSKPAKPGSFVEAAAVGFGGFLRNGGHE